MGILQRMKTLIAANINHLISKSEDPQKMLEQVMLDMRKQFAEAKQQVAVAIADEKRLEKQCENEKRMAGEWEERAMKALKAGEENLAKEALARKQEHANRALEFEKHWIAQKQATEQIRASLMQLNVKIEEARRKKDLLVARAKRAEAQKTIQETMSGLSDNSAFDTFDRMEKKVETIEAEAEATTQMAGEFAVGGDDLEKKFKELDKGTDTDTALLELKKKMGLLPSPDAKKTEEVKEAEIVEEK
jgi:phage shock protein A